MSRQPGPWRSQSSSASLARQGLGYAVGLLLGLRIAFSLFALVLSIAAPLRPPCTAGFGLPPAGTTAGYGFPAPGASSVSLTLFGAWNQWDACNYEQIAAIGYGHSAVSVAFFPLFPLVMRAAAIGLGSSLMVAGLLVSGAAYVTAMFGLHRLVAHDFDVATARRTVLFLSVFPTAFYLFAPFTEALFLALAVWALYAAQRGFWGWALAAALLASLTRAQGVLLALPLAWEVLRQRPVCAPAGRWLWPAALTGFLPLGALALFVGYGKRATGTTAFEALGDRRTSPFSRRG